MKLRATRGNIVSGPQLGYAIALSTSSPILVYIALVVEQGLRYTKPG